MWNILFEKYSFKYGKSHYLLEFLKKNLKKILIKEFIFAYYKISSDIYAYIIKVDIIVLMI